MDDLLGWCVFSAISILLVAVGGAFLPKYLQAKGGIQDQVAKERYTTAFKLGNIFSGGVMLSAGMVHLLGESIRIPPGKDKSYGFSTMRFPLAPFLTALGCLITLTMDALVDLYTAKKNSNRSNLLLEITELSTDNPQTPKHCNNNCDDEKQQCGGNKGAQQNGQLQVECQDKVIYRGMEMNGIKQVPPPPPPLPPQLKNGCGDQELGINGQGHAHGREELVHIHSHGEIPRDVSFLTGLVLAAALSVHSILEGAALGAQTSGNSLRDIFIAIVAHKGMAAYALGAALLESKPSNVQFWTVISTFCLASPIGIFVGYGISGLDGKAGLALSALAAGTFLYVALMEVIPKELGETKLKGWKMIFLWLGFSLMSMIAIWLKRQEFKLSHFHWTCSNCPIQSVLTVFGVDINKLREFFGAILMVSSKLKKEGIDIFLGGGRIVTIWG